MRGGVVDKTEKAVMNQQGWVGGALLLRRRVERRGRRGEAEKARRRKGEGPEGGAGLGAGG